MVGVLPTLLPKRRNAEPVKYRKVPISRGEDDGPSGTRTRGLRIDRLLTGMPTCAVRCRCVRPGRHPESSAVVFVMFCDVASGGVRLHGGLHQRARTRERGGRLVERAWTRYPV